MARIDADAAIAFLLGTMEVAFKPPDALYFRRHVAGLRFELLNADDVGTSTGEPSRESLPGRGPDTVQVERYNPQHFNQARAVHRHAQSGTCRPISARSSSVLL